MIRHLAELGVLLLLALVGVGLFTAFVIGLVWIWRPNKREDDGIDDFIQQLVERELLTHGPQTLPEALHEALGLEISNPFGGPWGFPTRTQFYDWARDV